MKELIKYYHIKPRWFYDHLTGLIAIIKIRKIQKRYIQNTHNHVSTKYTEQKYLMAKEEYYRSQFNCYGKWNQKIAYDNKENEKFNNFMNWLFPPRPNDFVEDTHVLAHSSEGMLAIKNKLFSKDVNFERLMSLVNKQRKNPLYER